MTGLLTALTIVAVAWGTAAAQPFETTRAQTSSQPLVVGDTFTIDSATLRETRRINVYTPAGYKESNDRRLPVLYMPDGGIAEDFLHVAGLVQVSVGNGTMRPFVLVGIENTERRRDLTPPTTTADDRKIAPRVGGAAAFRTFIRDELIPVIERRYRTTPERAIVGESLAGLFIMDTLLREPGLFTTYIAFDPSLWWNDGALITEASSRLRPTSLSRATVYMATGDDGGLDESARELSDALKAAGAQVTYERAAGETHATIYHPAALRAFRLLFKP